MECSEFHFSVDWFQPIGSECSTEGWMTSIQFTVFMNSEHLNYITSPKMRPLHEPFSLIKHPKNNILIKVELGKAGEVWEMKGE